MTAPLMVRGARDARSPGRKLDLRCVWNPIPFYPDREKVKVCRQYTTGTYG
jgi:hypothetical protein